MMKKNIEYEECIKIARLITEKIFTLKEIAKQYNVHPSTLRKRLKEYKISFIPNNLKISLSKEQALEIFNKYKNGESMKCLAKIYKISDYTLTKELLRNGYDIKKTKRYGKHKDFNLNKNIFENIDNEEKAYWLGFLLADGYISKNYDMLELGLQEKDLDHIIKFKNFLNSNIEPRYKEKTKSYTLNIRSTKICEDLKKQGVKNAKSLTCIFNLKILEDEKLKWHYIRGFWDGDGSIYITSKNHFNISMIGNKKLLESLQYKVKIFENLKIIEDKRSNACCIFLSNKRSQEFIKNIYKGSHVYLKRKFDKIIAVCDEKYPSISQIIRTE